MVPRPSMVDRWALQDFDLLGKEIFADADGGIADAIEETSLRASKPRMKKRSPKALPPSPVPSVTPAVVRADLLEAGGILVVEQFLGQDRDALRRIDDRLAEFRRRQTIRLVGRGGIGVRIAVGRRGRGCAACCGLLRLGILLGARGTAQCCAHAQLLGIGLGRRRLLARDRGIDGDRRQHRVLRLRRRDRCDGDQTADRDFLRGLPVAQAGPVNVHRQGWARRWTRRSTHRRTRYSACFVSHNAPDVTQPAFAAEWSLGDWLGGGFRRSQ